MTQNINFARVAIVLLFALTFAIIGWSAPVLYATYAPSDEVIEVHGYSAQDTTVNSEMHYVCFERTVTKGTSANVISEIYLVSDSGERILLETTENDRYFEEGRQSVVLTRQLPDNIMEGKYRYLAVAEIDMAGGRVVRTFSFESDSFNVTSGEAEEAQKPIGC